MNRRTLAAAAVAALAAVTLTGPTAATAAAPAIRWEWKAPATTPAFVHPASITGGAVINAFGPTSWPHDTWYSINVVEHSPSSINFDYSQVYGWTDWNVYGTWNGPRAAGVCFVWRESWPFTYSTWHHLKTTTAYTLAPYASGVAYQALSWPYSASRPCTYYDRVLPR